MEIIVPLGFQLLFIHQTRSLSWPDPYNFFYEDFSFHSSTFSLIYQFDLNNHNSLGFLEAAAWSRPPTTTFLFPIHLPFLIFSIPAPVIWRLGCVVSMWSSGALHPHPDQTPRKHDLTVVACLSLVRQSLPLIVL